MPANQAASVVASYSTYLDSFQKTRDSLEAQASATQDVSPILGVLKPFRESGSDAIPMADLFSKSGMDLLSFSQSVQDASARGLVSIDEIDGNELVTLSPVGSTALRIVT